MSRMRLDPLHTALPFALSFISGASALVYQILWIRSLSLQLGSTVFAISIVVSAFMAGLALGSFWFGARADRSRSPLRLFALLEGGIGACALALPLVFDAIDRLGGAALGSALWAWLPSAAGFVVLLVPTTLMGGTLPVLSRFLAAHEGVRGRLIGTLYAINTLGAIAGAALCGFVLVRVLGIQGAVIGAALLNFTVCASTLVIVTLGDARRSPADSSTQPAPQSPATGETALAARAEPAEQSLLAIVTAVYAINGFAGLALEILWTRAIVLFTINTIYAFTVILTTYLAGLALGASLMSALLPRVRHSAKALGGLQCLLALITALTPVGLGACGVPIFRAIQGATGGFARIGEIFSAYAIAALFALPATLVMGACFPLVARIAAASSPAVGKAIGRVIAFNTIGAVAGSLVAAFLLLPILGIQNAILLLAVLSALAGLALLQRTRARGLSAAALACALAAALLLLFSPNHLRTMLERWLDRDFIFYEEGVETTVAVYRSERARRPVLVINHSALDDHGVVHKMLAHLPALLHPDPRRALVLGFGVGISSQSLSTHGLEVNDCVEISPAVIDAAPSFAELNGNIAGRGDPHFRLFVEDARKLLRSGGENYDIIVLDANSGNLRNAGVGKLYSREFFELCRRRLSPEGMVTLYASPNGWMSEYTMIARTFTEVFPHATLWVDRVFGETTVLLGTRKALRIDLARYIRRIQREEVQRDLVAFDLDQPGALLASFTMGEQVLRYFCRKGALNTDDHPIMEFHPLITDSFDTDDRPFLDMGFQLHRESILPLLEIPDDLPRAGELRTCITMADRSFYSVLETWFHRANPNPEYARRAVATAADLFPKAEHIRTLLGYGRRQFRLALARARETHRPRDLGSAGWIALQREAHVRAATLFKRAIHRGERLNSNPALMASFHLDASRAESAGGRFVAAREHIEQASRLGRDSSLEQLELSLAQARERGTLTKGLLLDIAQVALERGKVARALQLLLEADAGSDLGPEMEEVTARCLEEVGDPAGAHHYHAKALAREPERGDARIGLRICALELALRADLMRKAYGDEGHLDPVLQSSFTGAKIPAGNLPRCDHESATPWLELAHLYRRSKRPWKSYRKARVARYYEPSNPATYMAIARAIDDPHNKVARRALERALALAPDCREARALLSEARKGER